jgi:hypothetical protein
MRMRAHTPTRTRTHTHTHSLALTHVNHRPVRHVHVRGSRWCAHTVVAVSCVIFRAVPELSGTPSAEWWASILTTGVCTTVAPIDRRFTHMSTHAHTRQRQARTTRSCAWLQTSGSGWSPAAPPSLRPVPRHQSVSNASQRPSGGLQYQQLALGTTVVVMSVSVGVGGGVGEP